ncbi:MAG TPA: heavy-metal-associated domain-containing protein [Noviherbaspirillum sp.]|nr:heavy-metal-associated domain-containing protein [Noviherbaspirillum sp.]
MKTENLSLSGSLDEASAMEAAMVLNTIKGVSKVAITTATGTINVSFDDEVTSLQEVRAALQKAGFGAKPRGHGEEGMCCGSCGS